MSKPTIRELEDILSDPNPGSVEIMPDGQVRVGNLERDLTAVLNRHCAENGSDTPDFIIAEYLLACLTAWNVGVVAREKWYGRRCGNGVTIAGESELPAPQPTDGVGPA